MRVIRRVEWIRSEETGNARWTTIELEVPYAVRNARWTTSELKVPYAVLLRIEILFIQTKSSLPDLVALKLHQLQTGLNRAFSDSI